MSDELTAGADGKDRTAAEMDADALELRRAGVPFSRIATQLGFPNATAARRGFDRAIAASSPEFVDSLEADRLDRIHAGVWTKAARGDVPAAALVLKISERREKLLRKPRRNKHELRTAFEVSAEAAPTTRADTALEAAGMKIADRIDEALAANDGVEVTKALYLVPHLVNILREMQATPTARLLAQHSSGNKPGTAGTGRTSPLGQLRLAEGERRAGSA